MDKIRKYIFKTPPYFFTLAVTLAVCYFTLVPNPLPSDHIHLFPHSDKVVHFIMFATLAGAILFDRCRAHHMVPRPLAAIGAMIISSLFGGIVEILQHLMELGRSADWLDFIADTIGAAFGAWLVYVWPGWQSVWRHEPEEVGLDCATGYSSRIDCVKKIYLSSFPEEERRPWHELMRLTDSVGGPFGFYIVNYGKRPAGLITAWAFPEFTYIEHFAIDSSCRGKGVGARILKEFVKKQSNPVVLEVEPESDGPLARRRIGFYKRCGFIAFPDFNYVQPPYAPGLPSVSLMLMATSADLNLNKVASTLHARVYGAVNNESEITSTND
ncbi:MAG: GNAT family N-acetyltransferase [Barnesiella sp.]|nr:GNAT family N-acetyltransferase [Barnesiella sp.]